MRWSSSCFVPPNKFPVFRFCGLETFPNPCVYTLQHSSRNCKCYLSRKTTFHVFTKIWGHFLCSKTEDNLYFKLSEELVTIQIPSNPIEVRQTDLHFLQKSPRSRFRDRHRGQNFYAACKIYLESSPLPCLAGHDSLRGVICLHFGHHFRKHAVVAIIRSGNWM